ncbi:MAG: chloramphenicol acetyltransferase [Bacteroidaceae bacterium]|nr:chloramphenicol acetyltransferase [Bacteroidaceae bacterium]
MRQEIDPKDSKRAEAYNLWMKSPMPMVTLTKTFDITRIYRISKRKGMKLNMLLCWCIGKAASQIEEFYTLPEKEKLVKYDTLAINVIVNNVKGGINSCDIPYTDDIEQFNADYTTLTKTASTECKSIFNEEHMIVGTSAMIATELDSVVNQYTELFCNPMVMWGKYRTGWFTKKLPISFQFHHVQMDGGHAANFLEILQQTINNI